VRLAAHFGQEKQAETEMISRLFGQLDKESRSVLVANQPGGLDDFCTFRQSGDRYASAEGSGISVTDASGMTPVTRQLCSDYVYQHALLRVAIDDLGKYTDSLVFKVSVWLLPIHNVCTAEDCAKSTNLYNLSRQEDAPSVAAMLAMMTTYLLPMSFGVAGTIAALLRGIQHRVNESTLAPRDLALSLFRLSLGMVAGISVGLFFTPSSNLVQSGSGIGTLTLSASGVAFLAGYGAEGFFRMLDALVAHLFTFERSQPQRPLG